MIDKEGLEVAYEDHQAQVEALQGKLEVFDKVAREIFSRNWNASDVVFELLAEGPEEIPITLTAGDFFGLHTALNKGE